MGDEILLTPTALAKHWARVDVPKINRATNQAVKATRCETCNGDRFVVVGLRGEIEEYAACPDCNPVDAGFWRHDGTRVTPPDPARVREMMRG
jgi:hypothetical protein